MKKILFTIGLVMLPISYIGVQKLNDQPIEWAALGLMALILLPLLFFKQIRKVEKTFDSLSDDEKKRSY